MQAEGQEINDLKNRFEEILQREVKISALRPHPPPAPGTPQNHAHRKPPDNQRLLSFLAHN